jgi:hypothetical protein
MADDSTDPSSLADAGTAPEKGGWYRLLRDYGVGVGMLTASVVQDGEEAPRQFRLLDVFEPGTPGIGVLDEESPVLLWLETVAGGRIGAHHIQFRMHDFLALFTVGAEPPEWQTFLTQQSGG